MFDYLSFIDGNDGNELKRICNDYNETRNFTLSSSQVLVLLKTDGSQSGYGIRLKYSADCCQDCEPLTTPTPPPPRGTLIPFTKSREKIHINCCCMSDCMEILENCCKNGTCQLLNKLSSLFECMEILKTPPEAEPYCVDSCRNLFSEIIEEYGEDLLKCDCSTVEKKRIPKMSSLCRHMQSKDAQEKCRIRI
jgi:hypothetical protein